MSDYFSLLDDPEAVLLDEDFDSSDLDDYLRSEESRLEAAIAASEARQAVKARYLGRTGYGDGYDYDPYE